MYFIYLFLIYLKTLSVAKMIQRQMLGLLVNNELEEIRTEAVLTYFKFLSRYMSGEPIIVVELTKARTVFTLSNAGIMRSNLTQNMEVYISSFCVYVTPCVSSGLAMG